MTDREIYQSHKQVTITPMSRLEYNVYRDWKLPDNENGDDKGFLIEEIGTASNDDRHEGFINWKPEAQFFEGYTKVTPDSMSEISDGYHTFNELYQFRKMLNAALFNEWAKQGLYEVHKSLRHHDGEKCFDGDYFIVTANLPVPGGQISNHYKIEDWTLFNIPDFEKAQFEFDGHTPADVLIRLRDLLCTHISLGAVEQVEAGETFSFGEAVRMAKLGYRVARKGWNGAKMFAYIVPANKYPADQNKNSAVKGFFDDDMVPYREYWALKTAQNDIATWAPSGSDSLANDWLLVK